MERHISTPKKYIFLDYLLLELTINSDLGICYFVTNILICQSVSPFKTVWLINFKQSYFLSTFQLCVIITYIQLFGLAVLKKISPVFKNLLAIGLYYYGLSNCILLQGSVIWGYIMTGIRKKWLRYAVLCIFHACNLTNIRDTFFQIPLPLDLGTLQAIL